MRQIEKTYKKGFLRKLLIKICRLLGYELIDQADMTFITSLNKENASIGGKKSITLPLGEIRIKRKIRSLDIILKTCTGVNLVSQNKNRIFEHKKSEYTFRTINSLLKSLRKSEQNINNIDYRVIIIDSGSSKEDKVTMREILEKSKFKFNFIELNLSDYLQRIKVIKKNNSQIESNMKSTMASIIKSFEISKNFDDLVYFVEDDYIHSDDCISEMLSVYEKFSTIFEDEVFIVPVDYPYLYQKNQSTNVLIGQNITGDL